MRTGADIGVSHDAGRWQRKHIYEIGDVSGRFRWIAPRYG